MFFLNFVIFLNFLKVYLVLNLQTIPCFYTTLLAFNSSIESKTKALLFYWTFVLSDSWYEFKIKTYLLDEIF